MVELGAQSVIYELSSAAYMVRAGHIKPRSAWEEPPTQWPCKSRLGREAGVGSRSQYQAGDDSQICCAAVHPGICCRWKIPLLKQCQFVPNSLLGKKKIAAVSIVPHLLLVSYSGASGLQRGCECQSGQCLGIGGCGASQDLLHHRAAVRRSAQALQRGIKERDLLPLRQAIGLFLFLSGVFAVVVATLLGTLKDVVGYIFTNDKWVNSFLLGIVTFLEGVIYIAGAAQKLLTDRVDKLPSSNPVPQRFLPTAQCHWTAWMLLTLGRYHGGTQAARVPSSVVGWDQALQLAEGDVSEPEPLGTGPCCFP